MIPYSIDSNIRIKVEVYLTLFAISVIPGLSSFVKGLPFYIAPLSALAVFWGLYFIFDHWVWRWPIIRYVHGIPYIGGEWKGKISWTNANKEQEESPVTAIVEQTWSKIRFDVNSDQATSFVRCASIYNTESSRKGLLFVYDLRDRKGSFIRADGCQEVDLEKGILEGKYFNSRHKKGALLLKQITD